MSKLRETLCKYSAKAFHELKKVRDTFKLIMYNMLHGEHCTCT